MKKVMIVLGVGLIFCGAIVGCKKKSEEEQIGELLGKLYKAEKMGAEKKAQRINKKIEKLTERQRKREKESITEVEAEIGKPLRWWKSYQSISDEIAQFSVTFEQVFVSKRVPPWGVILREKEDKNYLIVYARIENLGSREALPPSFQGRPKVKVADGLIYDAYVSMYRKMGYSIPSILDSKGWDWIDPTKSLKTGEKAWWAIFSEMPKEAVPVEFFGEIYDGYSGDRNIKFRLKLNINK